MNKGVSLIGGLGLGCGLMYFLDPDRGRRRRAVMRDKLAAGGHRLQRELGKAKRDIENRAAGVEAQAKQAVTGALSRRREEVDDGVLAARVRSKVGRAARQPHAIEVTADRGVVTVSGPILRDEADDLMAAVGSVRGVHETRNHLEVHQSAEGVPSLQGNGPPRAERSEPRQTAWTPALRVLAGVGGGALAAYGIARRGAVGAAAGVAGAAMLTRATANKTLRRVAGLDGSPAVDIHKTINIQAPPDEVFRFLTTFTNLPRFMAHLREVRDLGDGRYHWVADGPAGVPVSWEAEVTKITPGKLVEWKSLPGSRVGNSGSMRFDPNPDGGTRLTVRISYCPPAGVIGHEVASLFGVDPKHAMDDDFVRLKSLLEHGRTRVRGKLVTQEAVR
ncbi:MAG: SRPBCC family protein [Bryobacteraceae bacterium]|nr:SRPBCC family protein [Bryobacteraceae bacterium]